LVPIPYTLPSNTISTGIQIAELDPKTGFLLANQTPKTISKRTANGGSEEAPFIMKVGNYFYLFVSFSFNLM
jgi:beta-xylosidase